MKSILIFLIVFLLPQGILSPQGKTIKPVNAGSKIYIEVSGNSREYYPLDPAKENILQVPGPGKLKIITRVRFSSAKQNTLSYSVFYKIDGTNKIESRANNVKLSKNSKYKNKKLGTPGEEYTLTINLEEGEHTIQVWGGSKKIIADARYIFTRGKSQKLDWVSLSPLAPNDQVNLISDEGIIPYFRFSEPKPLKVRLTGPTKLRVLTRVENHYNMKGRIFYRIKVNEDGKLKNSYQLNSIRSESTSYQKDPKKVPGRAREIVIDVPEGTHTYEVVPLDEDKSTLLGKVLFPKKDMKVKE